MSSSSPPVPALQNGDRLTRDEFERRYEAMPHVKKAELIEGTVYRPPPVHADSHGRPHSTVVGWLLTYDAATPGVTSYDNATVRLDLDNEPQPDALLRINEDCGGQSRIRDDDYVEGAPELVVEVAHSSAGSEVTECSPECAAYDLHDKKRVYRRNGVQEYLVWQIEDERVDWFVLEGGEYLPLTPGAEGHLESRVFPGLVLGVDALLNEDNAAVLALLQARIGSEGHQTFVDRLVAR
jgi:Uma2 family endonuclease